MTMRILVAAAVAAALAIPAAAAAHGEDHTKDSGGPPVSGVLRDEGGTPLAGREVLLLAWPPGDRLRAMGEGETAPLIEVDIARTDDRGRFRLEPDASRLTRLGRDRVVDFTVVAPGDGTQPGSAFSFSRQLTAKGRWIEPGADPKQTPAPVAVALTAGGAGTDGRADTAPTGAVGPLEVISEPPSVANRTHLCRANAGEILDPEWTAVGEVAATTGSTAIFKYKRKARSSLGVGISYDWGLSFSAAGTRSERSEDKITFPAVSGANKIFLTQFRYRLWEIECRSGPFDFRYRYDHTELRVHDWVGGAASYHFWPRDLDFCNNYEAGSAYERDREAAVRYRPALSVLDTDLSGRTGYSRKAKVRYSFHQDMSMCGDTDFAPKARRIGSKNVDV